MPHITSRGQPRPHRHHTASANAVELAVMRSRPLTDAQVRTMRDTAQAAVAAFVHGTTPWRDGADIPTDADFLTHWRNLADTLNMAREFTRMGLASGADAERVLEQSDAAVGAILARRDASAASGEPPRWDCTTDEHEALCWLVHLHYEVQCRTCSLGEFERAYKRVCDQARQALAGNAGPGVRVINPSSAPTRTAAANA